jgi:hypothetical protein
MILAACLVLAIALVLALRHRRPQPNLVTASPITIERVREVAEFATLEIPFQQVVQARLSGYTGGTKCLVLAAGEASVGSDLDDATLDVDRAGKTVTVTLPTPTVRSARLDQARSSVVMIQRSGLWRIVPGPAGEDRVIERALREAERQMAEAARRDRHVEAAKRQAERVFADLAREHGWAAAVRWTAPP